MEWNLWLFLLLVFASKATDDIKVYEEWIEQPVDHSSWEAGKFKQRFFRIGKSKNNGKALLLMGGEEGLSHNYLRYSLVGYIARQYGMSGYALEHRYYGQSRPTSNLSTANLRYLNSTQALLDAVRFMRMRESRWVVVGGSYGGILAAQARQTYPNLVIGAVASSSPIYFKEDFHEFDTKIQASIENAAGKKCLDFHLKLAKDIDIEIKAGNSLEIKERFGCQRLDDFQFADALTFFANIFQLPNQEAIINHCKHLLLDGNRDERINSFSLRFKSHYGTSYNKSLTDLEDVSYGGFLRQWIYQCCTEFGFWQTSPKPPLTSTRSTLLNLEHFKKRYCHDLFGENIPKSTPLTVSNFNNIFFTNGELDPWASLSPSNLTILGATHSNDLDQPNIKDSTHIKSAKTILIKVINNYFNEI